MCLMFLPPPLPSTPWKSMDEVPWVRIKKESRPAPAQGHCCSEPWRRVACAERVLAEGALLWTLCSCPGEVGT